MPSRPAHVRNRHLPRVCRHCHAPMASGADSCWHCGTQWATEEEPATTLRLVPDPPPASDTSDQPVMPRVAAASASAGTRS